MMGFSEKARVIPVFGLFFWVLQGAVVCKIEFDEKDSVVAIDKCNIEYINTTSTVIPHICNKTNYINTTSISVEHRQAGIDHATMMGSHVWK